MAKMRMKAKTLFMTVPFRLRPGGGVQEAETQARRDSAAAMRSTSAFCCDMAGADRTTWWGYALPLRQCSAGDIQTIEETRVASFRKLLVAGTAIAAGLEIGRANV